MNNKIIYVTKEEAQAIKRDALQNKDIFWAEIEGTGIKTEEDYVQAMASAFDFPGELPEMKIGWYNDYINDLMWIKQKSIILMIHDYDSMLVDNPEIKEIIIEYFQEITLPWWEGEIIGHMVGGTPKSFLVYLERLS
ncbi:MAG: barstar family protein [Lachnospiraceae bacterium]|nr:barstar family protein [Lachnospiraceae bacterium]